VASWPIRIVRRDEWLALSEVDRSDRIPRRKHNAEPPPPVGTRRFTQSITTGYTTHQSHRRERRQVLSRSGPSTDFRQNDDVRAFSGERLDLAASTATGCPIDVPLQDTNARAKSTTNHHISMKKDQSARGWRDRMVAGPKRVERCSSLYRLIRDHR